MSLIYSGKKLISGGATKLSEMVNDVGFVTKTIDNLVNYYNKNELDKLIGNLDKITLKIVDNLPTEDISTNTIYLTKISDGVYEQHLWITSENQFVSLGTTKIALEDYAKVEDIPKNIELLNKFSTDENGNLLYDGSPIEGMVENIKYASSDDIDALFI